LPLGVGVLHVAGVDAIAAQKVDLPRRGQPRFLAGDWIRVDLPTGTEITQVTGISGDDLTVSPALSSAPVDGTTVYPASVRIYLFNTSGSKVTGDWSCVVKGY